MWPHLLVAVDFGTEFTKAAYSLRDSMNQGYDPTATVVNWTKDRSKSRKILPTAVTRWSTGCSFGWDALADGENDMFENTFVTLKIDLLESRNEVYAVSDPDRRRPVDIIEITSDFLRYVFGRVKDVTEPLLLQRHGVSWSSATIHLLKEAVRRAGFAAPNHRMVGDMTEAKAAARNALEPEALMGTGQIKASTRLHYTDGETCILVDGGGGTADVCVFRIASAASHVVEPLGVEPEHADNIGGTRINKDFQERLQGYFTTREACLSNGISLILAARVLAWCRAFGDVKKSVGELQPHTSVRPPNLAPKEFRTVWVSKKIFGTTGNTGDDNGLRVQYGVQEVDIRSLESCLSFQVFGNGQPGSCGIWGLIGTMIDNVYVSERDTSKPSPGGQAQRPGIPDAGFFQESMPVTIDHIVLSGGFGAQPYVHAAIGAAIRRGTQIPSNKHTGICRYRNLAGVHLWIAREPQLSVARGLIGAYRDQLGAEAAEEAAPVKKTWLRIRVA